MKLVKEKEEYKDCIICVNAIKDRKQNLIGCRVKPCCVFKSR